MKDFSELKFKTTKDIEVPELISDQIIGQENAVQIIKKSAKQRRHVLLIGEPGTGKSMLGQALAQLLPNEKLVDEISLPNPHDENNPLIRTVKAGDGAKLVAKAMMTDVSGQREKFWVVFIGLFVLLNVASYVVDWVVSSEKTDVLQAADRISGTIFLVALLIIFMIIFVSYRLQSGKQKQAAPKIIVDNRGKKQAPFIDATGAHAGALLGDVLHDPFQSGGLGTPAHERVIAGAIHKANGGVLFIDEIGTLKPEMQVEMLTAMQEKKYPITGQSERSAGAMVKTEAAPADFILVAAGNIETLQHMHPALRSRVRGGGYEVYMNTRIEDTPENRQRIARFVAQEVKKDGKIPHFSRDAVIKIIEEARRRAGRKGYLTLKLRDLGGLVRVAGDLALEAKSDIVDVKHVINAKQYAASLETQLAERYTKEKKDYQLIRSKGDELGRVNGLAVISNSDSGIVLPIEATVTPALAAKAGKIIATGKLGEIAKEAIINVSAIIKKYSKHTLSNYDMHVQFLQTYEGLEGDSASISVATAVISSLERIPIRQDTAMTGSISIRGEVLPIGGVNAKIEAAVEAGIKRVIIPKANENDVMVDKTIKDKIKIIPADTITDVLDNALDWKGKDKSLLKQISKAIPD